LQQNLPPAEVVRQLARAHGVSTRQAHRYVQLAQESPVPVPVPEIKAVFTVKLPRRLIGQVRSRARKKGEAISDWVTAALREALEADSPHG
jgi:hypothetical protein